MGNIYEPGTTLKVFTEFSSIKQDGSNRALWKSDNFLFFKWPVLRQHDDLYVKMNEIIYGIYIRPWKNLKGLSSDKRDSGVSWNKMNLTLPCGNLTFYLSRLISNRRNVQKMELVLRKLWQTNCKPFKIVQEKWDYILNLHTYVLHILHYYEAGSWENQNQELEEWFLRRGKIYSLWKSN